MYNQSYAWLRLKWVHKIAILRRKQNRNSALIYIRIIICIAKISGPSIQIYELWETNTRFPIYHIFFLEESLWARWYFLLSFHQYKCTTHRKERKRKETQERDLWNPKEKKEMKKRRIVTSNRGGKKKKEGWQKKKDEKEAVMKKKT